MQVYIVLFLHFCDCNLISSAKTADQMRTQNSGIHASSNRQLWEDGVLWRKP